MNITTPKLYGVDPVADLPLLWTCLQRLELIPLVERLIPKPLHWKGDLSVGQVVAVMVLYFTSQADHRLVAIEDWAQQHHALLNVLLGVPFRAKDCHDDRLADILSWVAQGDTFAQLEMGLNQNILRVYELPTAVVRCDTTTVSVDRQDLDELGLVQFGHSKDDPSRPQIKIAAAVVDPLGLPVYTTCVSGNTADDSTYVPAFQAVINSLPKATRLFVGDCKMAAQATRAFLVQHGQHYLCPLSEKQLSTTERLALLAPVFRGEQVLQPVYQPAEDENEPPELVAQGFVVPHTIPAAADSSSPSWVEQRWFVRSVACAQAAEESLERKLEKAVALLTDLPVRRQRKKVLNYEQLQQASQEIIQQHRVEGLVSYQINRQEHQKTVRGYGSSPDRVEVVEELSLVVAREEATIALRKGQLGWQVYACADEKLTLSDVVWAYRGQYRMEKVWSRYKGQPLCLTPVYLQEEDRMVGLVYLLSIAIRLLSLLEWQVHAKLAANAEELRGLYPSQSGRKTSRPSVELLLRAFQKLSISVITVNGIVQALLTPLTPLQQRLLVLLGLPPDLYDSVAQQIQIFIYNTSEP